MAHFVLLYYYNPGMRRKDHSFYGRIIDNLQTKVTFLFLAASLLPLVMVSAFAISTADELIMEQVTNQLESVADDKLNLLERWLSERRADLQVVADSSIVRSLDPDPIASYLDLVRDNYKVYREFMVISREGKIIFGAVPGLSAKDPVREQWFLRTMEGDFYQSDIFFQPGSKESSFQISLPVREDGEIIGAVRATVGTESIISAILRVSLGETGEVYLVDDQGVFLAHKDPRKILSENIARSGSFRKIFQGQESRIFYTDYRGIEVLGASRHVSDTDWHLVVEQDREEAFASVFLLKRVVYAVLFGSVLITVTLAWILASYIVRPIQDLSGAAEALANGDFNYDKLRLERGDEIGALFRSFGEMARQLQVRQSSLEEKVGMTEAELKETDVKLKKTEAAAVRSQQLASLGRLAAGVTHEIRTPLSSIKLFLQSLEEDTEFTEDAVEDHRIAMAQVKRIETTINRFLDFAKPQEPVRSVIEVEALIEEALEVVKPRATQQEIMVVREIASDLPMLWGDRKQLAEVLINLMVNALEAMSKGDTLTVHAIGDRRALLGVERDCVRIEVADTGQGISPANLENLFDPFFTTKASGAGLGLSIVHETVVRHGGIISVESRIGDGSTFRVYLPGLDEQNNEDDEQNFHS